MGRQVVSAKELAYYRAHFREALREDGVVCLECGGLYKTMGGHVVKHGLTLEDYRQQWGYNRQTAFAAADTHEKMRQHAVARNLPALAPADTLLKAWEARRYLVRPSRPESRLVHGERLQARYAAQPARLKKAADDTLGALASKGLTTREIAARTGLDASSVRRRPRALGLVAAVPALHKASDEALLVLRRAGLRGSEIATRIGMSTTGVKGAFGSSGSVE